MDRFTLDELPAIIKASVAKIIEIEDYFGLPPRTEGPKPSDLSLYPRENEPWNGEDDALIMSGDPLVDVAQELERSYHKVSLRHRQKLAWAWAEANGFDLMPPVSLEDLGDAHRRLGNDDE